MGNDKAKQPDSVFNKAIASDYDNKREKLAAIKDALHLCIRVLLSKQPSNARALIIGAGTGAELLYLAQAFPSWHFTVIEPASAMLEICRQRAEQYGIASRCTFHEGYIDTLPAQEKFDVATSILVSHFLIDQAERTQYFKQIATIIRTGGYFIEASLASGASGAQYKYLLEAWISMHDYADMPANIESFGKKVAVLSPEKIEAILKSAGFDTPVSFFQSFLIHAWFVKWILKQQIKKPILNLSAD